MKKYCLGVFTALASVQISYCSFDNEWMDRLMDLVKANAVLAGHGSVIRTVSETTQLRWTHEQSPLRDRAEFEEKLRADLTTLFGAETGTRVANVWFDELHEYILGHPSHEDYNKLKHQDWVDATDNSFVDEESDYYGNRPPPPEGYFIYTDKYVRDLLETYKDPDCISPEVDLASPDFTIEKAVQIWHKCRYLVLRNIIDAETIREFRSNVTQFVYDLRQGKVNANGTTSYFEPYYVHEVESLRWDLLLPEKYAQNEQVLANPTLMKILSDERVLGEQQKCLAYGLVLAEPQAKQQMWHTDTPGLFHDSYMLDSHGFSGHELPTTSLVMFSPLLQRMTPVHGPTQFCIAASTLNGIDWASGMNDQTGWHAFLDYSIRDEFIRLAGGSDYFDLFSTVLCPPSLWKSIPYINAGDMVLWDYATIHRAGPNHSEDFRSALYVAYSRNLVKDLTFEGYRKGELGFEETCHITGRFAQPNQAKEGYAQTCKGTGDIYDVCDPKNHQLIESLNKMFSME